MSRIVVQPCESLELSHDYTTLLTCICGMGADLFNNERRTLEPRMSYQIKPNEPHVLVNEGTDEMIVDCRIYE